jgi:hypothetical protein
VMGTIRLGLASLVRLDRFGSKADLTARTLTSASPPETGHRSMRSICPKRLQITEMEQSIRQPRQRL